MPTMLEDMEDKREAVGARLCKVREILGLSKKEFAERAGLSEQVYGPFENARRELSLQSAKRLRATYGLPLEFMYFGKIDDLPTRISREL
ncbi:helix-turn-helix domain-containing protein [uncultured Ruegeria sp.]|uniref:helix-turn-helix domain-containing protein n=1 Tax=uncultured Ruegeria sp. TaxID=259304 RepID=UPI0026273DB5|nr:helix-turn-helix domain-containing protein [uncultured Ruegeria sp.]